MSCPYWRTPSDLAIHSNLTGQLFSPLRPSVLGGDPDHVVSDSTVPRFIARCRRARARQRRIVGDDDDRGAVGVDAIEQIGDLLAGVLVELAGRLVGEQQRRPVRQRARDRHPLHLAAGQLRRPVIARDRRGRRTRAARACARAARPWSTPASACGSSMFSHAVEHRQQEEPLEDEADPRQADAAALRLGQRRRRRALRTASEPLVGLIDAAEQVQQRRLAAARRPGDRDVVAARRSRIDTSRERRHRPAGIGNVRVRPRPSTIGVTWSRQDLAPQRRRDRQAGREPDRVDRGQRRRSTASSAEMQHDGPRLEDEEVQPLGNARHLAQDAIEHRPPAARRAAAQRGRRRRPAAPIPTAASPRSAGAGSRARAAPPPRRAAGSPTRSAASRPAGTRTRASSTTAPTEIWRK